MRRDVIVIGASAGGVEALRVLVAGFPADLPATVLVVLHVPPTGPSALPAILDRAGPLTARLAVTGEPLPRSVVLVAPPDRHLAVRDGRVAVTRGPRENGHRPAIDVLFRSAASAAGQRVIGVILSGTLDDGTAGLSAVVACGGTAVVQDPADALYPGMPRNALGHVRVQHVAPVVDLAGLLARLCAENVPAAEAQQVDGRIDPQLLAMETGMALLDDDAMNEPDRPGQPSGFSCPDCNGVLWEIADGDLARYRCRVGHAWSSESLFGEQTTRLDDALWMALRGLEEKAALARTLAERAAERGSNLSSSRYAERAVEATRAASTIRALLESHLGLSDDGATTA